MMVGGIALAIQPDRRSDQRWCRRSLCRSIRKYIDLQSLIAPTVCDTLRWPNVGRLRNCWPL